MSFRISPHFHIGLYEVYHLLSRPSYYIPLFADEALGGIVLHLEADDEEQKWRKGQVQITSETVEKVLPAYFCHFHI